MARCITFPHPFSSDRKIENIPNGTTVEDAIISQNIEKKFALNIIVHIWKGDDGETFHVLNKREWETHQLSDDETMVINTQPKGAIGSAVSGIAGFIGGLSPIQMAFGKIVGALGLNALLGGKQRKFSQGQGGSFSNSYNLTGPANRRRIYEPIERVYGKNRVYPSLAAGSFSTCTSAKQAIDALFCYGYGPLQIEEIKLGETDISNVEGQDHEIRYGYDTDLPINKFPSGTKPDIHNINMTDRVKYVKTTSVECIKADVEIVYPNGIYRVISLGPRAVFHPIFIEYKKKSDPESAYVLAYRTPDSKKFKRKSTVRFTETRTIDFPEKGEYDIRVHVERHDKWVDNGESTSIWTQTKCITGDDEVLVSIPGVALMSIALSNAQSTNGQIENLSAICTSILNVWDEGTSAWIQAPTSNPAWIYLDILTGSANSRKVSYDRVDLDSLKEWAMFCDEQVDGANRFEFNGIFDTSTTTFEALRTVALAGRASFAMVDGKFSVVVDDTKDTAIQQFTPRNSWNFSSVKYFAEETDAIRARYVNPDNFWQQDEIIVYDDGKDKSNSELFTEVEYFGITSKTQAHRLSRYDLAVRKLRPEVYSIDVDVENIVCTRGDRVKASHDIPGWGISSGRISSVKLSVDLLTVIGLTLDGKVVFELGKMYGLTVRKPSGIVSYSITGTGTTREIILLTAIPVLDAPAVGDLYSFGEATRETVDLVVKSITYKNDLAATLQLVDYSPDIFNADTEDIPPFDPQQSEVPQLPIYAPPTPEVIYVASDDSVLLIDQDGLCTPRMLIVIDSGSDGNVVPRQAVQLRYRKEGDQYWDFYSNTSGVETDFYLDNVEVDDEKQYEFAVRAISRTGVYGEWSETQSHFVVGQIVQPTDAYTFVADVKNDYISFTWEHDGGHLGTKVWFEFRIGESWDDGTFLDEPDDVYSYLLAVENAETFTVWVRAKNQAGLYSPNAQSLLIEAVRPDDVFAFNGVESGVNIDFTWDPVDGAGIIYEIREGLSWSQSTLIIRTSSNGTTVAYPVPEVETHTFFIKAKSTNGLYSENASTFVIELNPDLATLILESNRKALLWDGQRLNFDITGTNDLRSSGTYSEYVYQLDLGTTQRTNNFFSLAVNAIARPELTWDEADFIWASDRADSQWDNEGGETEFSYGMQIALYLDTLPAFVYENFDFDNTLVGSVLTTNPTVSENIAYLPNRFHDGVHMQDASKLAYDLNIPEEFSMSFTWQGKDQTLLGSGVNHIMRLEDNAGTRMLVLQDETSFYLLDENNNQLDMDMVIEADHYYNIVIGQYAGSRTFGVYDVANDKYEKDTGNFAPITTFTKINFRFKD